MIQTISEGKNHKAINMGSLDKLSEYDFIHPRLGTEVKGKLFIGELLNSTGAEVSFRDLPARTTISFLHKHKKHEEIYIVLKGIGKYQVDDDIFPIETGSIIRVSPEGIRTLCNDSDESMIYMVIQSHADTLTGYTIHDGYRVKGDIRI